MTFFVYILKSKKDNKRYIGMTSNIQHRLFQHNSGLVKSTKNRIPLELIYSESFENKSDAIKREKQLKAKKGKLSLIKQTSEQ